MTPPDITEEELAAIKQRANAATPGPWQADDSDTSPITFEMKCGGESCNFEDCDLDVEVHTCDLAWGELSREDTAFIAASRSDVPRLVAALRSRDTEIDRLNGIYESAVRGRADMRDALRKARAPLGITEWSTVEAVERVIAERDAAKEQFARAVALLREEYQRRFLADEAHHEWSKRVGDLLAEQEAK